MPFLGDILCLPDLAQNLGCRQLRQPWLFHGSVGRGEQLTAIGADGSRKLKSRSVALRQEIVLHTATVPLEPNRGCQGLQPVRRDYGKFIQRGAHGFSDALKPVEPAHSGQHVR